MSGATSVYHILQTADFMSFDHDLWLCPRFEKLHVFNIMALQDRLSKLEKKLIASYSNEEPAGTESWPNDDVQLVKDIRETIKAYGSAETPLTYQRYFTEYDF
jgi:hypothetical protein